MQRLGFRAVLGLVIGFSMLAQVFPPLGVQADVPTNVSTCTQFEDMDLIGGTYQLTTDLDCTSEGNDIIVGDALNPFRGTFDGQGFAITVDIANGDGDTYYTGLFAQLQDATITDLVIHGSVASLTPFVGSLAGGAFGETSITFVESDAAVTGSSSAGGLVGNAEGTDNSARVIIEDSVYSGTLAGVPGIDMQDIGGMIGYATYTTLSRNTSTAVMNLANTSAYAVFAVGGLVGDADNQTTFIENETDINIQIGTDETSVSTSTNVGGMIGYSGGHIFTQDNTADGTVTMFVDGEVSQIGGFIGVVCDAQEDCTLSQNTSHTDLLIERGTADRAWKIGGFAGYYEGEVYDSLAEEWVSSDASDLTATGSVTLYCDGTNSVSNVGGLIGLAHKLSLSDISATGSVEIQPLNESEYQVDSIGGVVGRADTFSVAGSERMEGGTITINANGVYAIGGVAGYVDDAITLNNVQVQRDFSINEFYAGDTIAHIGGLIGETNTATVTSDVLYEGTMDIGGEGSAGGDSVYDIGGIIGYANHGTYLEEGAKSKNAISISANENAWNIGGAVGRMCDATYDCQLNQVGHEGNLYVYSQAVWSVGGLVGSMDSGEGDRSILQSYTEGDLTVTAHTLGQASAIGGLVGDARNILLEDVYAYGDITVNTESGEGTSEMTDIGGLVGYLDSALSVDRAYYQGEIMVALNGATNVQHLGGLLGEAYVGQVHNSFTANTMIVNGDIDSTYGAFAGLLETDNPLYADYYGFSSGEGATCLEEGGTDEACVAIDNLSDTAVFFQPENVPFYNEDDGQVWNNETVWYFSELSHPLLYWSIDVPTVTTSGGEGADQESVYLYLTIDDVSLAPVDEYGFQYGETDDYGSFIFESGEGPYSEDFYGLFVDGLDCGTTYHFRGYAHNFAGNGYGEDDTVSTTACPRRHGGGGYIAPDEDDSTTSSSSSSSGSSSGSSTPSTSSTSTLPTNVTSSASSSYDDFTGHEQADDSGLTGPSPFDGVNENISNVAPGWYIRGENYDTVYYVTSEGTRRPFWDTKTFFTYADSWDEVVWVTDATLATLVMDDPMLPKAGVVLVKVQSDATTYAIEDASTLRSLPDEGTAITLYGSEWSDYVIDVEPTIMKWFTWGDPMTDRETVNRGGMKKRASLSF